MMFTAVWWSGSATDSYVVGEWNEQVELFINWLPQNHAILPSESRISGFNGAKTKQKEIASNLRVLQHKISCAQYSRQIGGAAEVDLILRSQEKLDRLHNIYMCEEL